MKSACLELGALPHLDRSLLILQLDQARWLCECLLGLDGISNLSSVCLLGLHICSAWSAARLKSR